MANLKMNQFNEYISPINPISRANKNFVYKGKKYPIDFSLVKKYSNYFYNNKAEFKSIEDIEIKPANYELTEEVMSMFTACCQNKPFNINNLTVFPLHQLSIQYEVPVLNEITSKCIDTNKKPLVFQSIFFKIQQKNFDIKDEEETIALNFFDFINDEQLLSLPMPVLYRIINNDHLKLNSMNSTNQSHFVNFLFKCLDKHKRKASILFLNLDLENERIDLLSQLFVHYSDVFDFNMINSKFLAKNTSFLLSEMKKLKIEYANKLSEIESENIKQKQTFDEAQKSFDISKNQLLNSNRLLENRIQKLENELLNQKKEQDEQKNQIKQMEEKLKEQERFINKFCNQKVTNIVIKSDQKFLLIGSTITLSTSIKPKLALNDDVEWQVVQEIEGSVEVKSMDNKTLVLKCLKQAKKVTIVAKALDGSGVTATKEIIFAVLKGTIDVNVEQQDQTIKGEIKITEVEKIVTLDKSKSKYILNSSSSSCLGFDAYQSGLNLDSLVKEVAFSKSKGEYYLHVLFVDNFGFSQELVSQPLKTNGAFKGCFYDGNDKFNGILNYLTRISGGNIIKNNTIELKCSHFCCGSIENFVDLNCVDNIHVTKKPPRWIQYDFKDRQIQINSYTIKSSNRDARIKSWKIEISNDGNKWTKIDEQNDVTDLNGKNITKLIQIQMSQSFRFLRLITDQKCFDEWDEFSIGKLEFFGKILLNSK